MVGDVGGDGDVGACVLAFAFDWGFAATSTSTSTYTAGADVIAEEGAHARAGAFEFVTGEVEDAQGGAAGLWGRGLLLLRLDCGIA